MLTLIHCGTVIGTTTNLPRHVLDSLKYVRSERSPKQFEVVHVFKTKLLGEGDCISVYRDGVWIAEIYGASRSNGEEK